MPPAVVLLDLLPRCSLFRLLRSLVFGLMALHVESEMVGAGEASLADVTAERFGASVLPDVTCELV